MQTTFELQPEEWTEGFWKKIMPLFRERKVRITVEEMVQDEALGQLEAYGKIKALQDEYPPIEVDETIDLTRLADNSNDRDL